MSAQRHIWWFLSLEPMPPNSIELHFAARGACHFGTTGWSCIFTIFILVFWWHTSLPTLWESLAGDMIFGPSLLQQLVEEGGEGSVRIFCFISWHEYRYSWMKPFYIDDTVMVLIPLVMNSEEQGKGSRRRPEQPPRMRRLVSLWKKYGHLFFW